MNVLLTPKQLRVLDCILISIEVDGVPPTRAEIAQHLGYRSDNAAHEMLKRLERLGVIELRKGISRGIKVVEQKESEERHER